MSVTMRYRCLNCGNRFETIVLTVGEVEEAKLQERPLSSVHCPDCRRRDVRRGWD